FSWRRSLLPISLVRFDEAARALRIGLDKDLASRYPAFERHEFEKMDEDAVRSYEARVMAFFPRSRTTERVPPIAEGERPEWLVKSVWLTARPGHPDPLSQRKSAM